jgi:ATP-dependent exoDNAse (exonuclease V) alpha subunit
VAIYYLNMKTFGRSAGNRATSAAAYRSGERIKDERTGNIYNHSRRTDVLHTEIVLPSRFAAQGAQMDWARDRSKLWNAAEHAESRRNARVAREYAVALAAELTPEQRLGLVRNFAQELADRYQFAVDFAIHAPKNDPRNYHAHLLATTREVTPDGLGPKTALDVSGPERERRGLRSTVQELISVRERWAVLTNEALRAANVPARVSHLSYAAQGLDRVPGRHLGRAATESAAHMEKSGVEPASAIAPVVEAGAAAAQVPATQLSSAALGALDEMQRLARNNWLELRRQALERSQPTGAQASAVASQVAMPAQSRGVTGPTQAEHAGAHTAPSPDHGL